MKLKFLVALGSLTIPFVHADLVGHWPLDSDADDATPNGNHGAVVGGIVNFGEAGANSNTGSSASFPNDGHIDIPFSTLLNPESFTLSLWTKTAGGSGFRSPFTSRTSLDENRGYFLYQNSLDPSLWEFWTGNGLIDSPQGWSRVISGEVSEDVWTHLAISYDAATQVKRHYIDGVLVDTVTGSQSYTPVTADTLSGLHIGSGGDDGNEFFFSGNIDDVAVFDDALTLAEINSGLLNGAVNALPDPRVRVPFDGLFTVQVSGAGAIELLFLNDGASQNLTFTSVDVVTGDDSDHFSIGVLPTAALPGENVALMINFDPLAENGQFTGEFTVMTNDPINSSITFALEVTVPNAIIQATTPALFSKAGTGLVDVANDAAAVGDLDISGVTIVGPDASFFSVTDFPMTGISSGNTAQISVLFDPRLDVGTFNAQLVIVSNDEATPTLLVPLGGNVEVNLEDALVGWWPLDSDANDASGNANNGVADGSVLFSQDGANTGTGSSASFSGNGGIEVPWSTQLNPRSFTATLWVNSSVDDDNDFHTPLSTRDDVNVGENRHGWSIYTNRAADWDFWSGAGLGTDGEWNPVTGPSVIINTWQHLALSYDHVTNTKRMYIDGVEVASGNPVGFSPNRDDLGGGFIYENENLYIGSGGDSGDEFLWEGGIDDVALFNIVLTQEQIANIATNGVASVAGNREVRITSTNYDLVDRSFTMNWEPVPGVAEYAIERAIGSLDSMAWEEIEDADPSTVSFTDFFIPENAGKVFYRLIAR